MRASRLCALLLLAATLSLCRAAQAHETVALFRSEIVPEARLLSTHHETDEVSFIEAGAEAFVSLRSLESARQVITAAAPSPDTIVKMGLPDNSTNEGLEYAGTRCVCSLFTTSAGAEGIATSAGRTVVSGFCQSSPGLENSEDCVCGGMAIPCYSKKPKVSTFTFSSFIPGLCNAVSNGTVEGQCEGEPCPNFGIKENVYTSSRIQRTVNQSREECAIRVDRQGCTTPKPCDCKLGPWSDWSICDKECGIGEMRRTRNILSPASNGGKCSEQVERLPCKNAECVQDCVVSDWSVWSGCSAACGEGLVYRHRIVLQTALNGGRPCPPLLQSKKCTGIECPANVTCEFSAWSDWSNCSANCGSPTKTRTRTLLAPTLPIGTPACAWCTACGVLKEAKPCNTAPCPVDCVVSPWSEFSACSAPCGGGAMTRTRNVLISPANNGKSCPRLYETLPCNTQECSSDCKVGDWGPWSACGSGCGAGIQTRTRPVLQAAAGGGKACPQVRQTRPCLNAPCNKQCQLSEWSAWSACSRSCGGGIRERTRSILRVPANVTDCGSLGEVAPCNTQPCPKDCAVTSWHASAYPHVGQKFFPIDGFEAQRIAASTVRNLRSRPHRVSNATIPKPRERSRQGWARKWIEEDKTLRALFNTSNKQELMDMFGWKGGWSECSEQCGQGWMTRERHVLTKQWHGGQTCPALVENKPCSMLPCPSDCVVSPWTEWSSCSQVCGDGIQTRTRTILALPRHTGKYCPHLAETRSCALRPCNPAVCPKSYWSTWSGCSAKCGGGVRNRTRLFASQPAPGTFSGLYECGNLTDIAPCNTKPCPIDCQVTDWSDWSQCSQLCGGGIQHRTRAVTVPNSHGGRPCPRSLLEVRACQTLPCPVGCKVSAWSSWSDCSSTCGDGVQYRSREVEQPALFGGPKCPPLLESRNCRSKPCPEGCEYSQWSNWTQCSVSCGTGGIQTRARSVLSKPNSTSAANTNVCGETVQSLPCNTFQCPTDCKVGEWTKYKGCNSKCDGTKSRSRPILQPDINGGRPCPAVKKTKACSRKKCETTTYKLQHPVNCEYHEPGPWGPCMADCNALVSGVRVRVTQAKGTSRDRGCQDIVEEQRCVMPDSVSKLRKSLKKELEDQLPPKEVMDAEGRKVKVNVKLDVQVTHQGRDGKICPLVSHLTIN